MPCPVLGSEGNLEFFLTAIFSPVEAANEN
jgi:hypothetical protein